MVVGQNGENALDSLYLTPRLDDVLPGFAYLSHYVLCKVDLLDLDHLAAHGAEVEQGEDVDLQDLKVGELIHCFLELSLLSGQIGPERVLHFAHEVRHLKRWRSFLLLRRLWVDLLSDCSSILRWSRLCFWVDLWILR